eukprot:gene40327-57479_t
MDTLLVGDAGGGIQLQIILIILVWLGLELLACDCITPPCARGVMALTDWAGSALVFIGDFHFTRGSVERGTSQGIRNG